MRHFRCCDSLAAVSAAAVAGVNDVSQKAVEQTSSRQQVLTSLEQAGFADVKVTAGSTVVQARDRSGHPVTMFIGPQSAGEMVTTGASERTSSTGSPSGVAWVHRRAKGGRAQFETHWRLRPR